MNTFVEKLFGDQNKKIIKKLRKKVVAINDLEESIQALDDDALRHKTVEFRERIEKKESLDAILPEAFAVVREAARRTLGQRHYDVQLIGGLVLDSGSIAEMRTGEGKTLSATTAAYMNALSGEGVHIVTVNDYLARRDADWMGQVYHFLGLSVGCLQNNASYMYEADMEKIRRQEKESTDQEEPSTEGDGYESLIVADMEHLRTVSRKEVYACDIVFGTNNEFGFDYLRDNMVQRVEDRVQRGLHYAIIDEVDSILIDEARTPLIISAPAEEATEQYYAYFRAVSQLAQEEHFLVDEKMKSVSLTNGGIEQLEKLLQITDLYGGGDLRRVHMIEQALKARMLFQKDRDYVVQDGEIIIIDEFTGRMMQGRRYSEGLHQAIEAKEQVEIKQESQTLATITLQNFFRLYKKLSGMTGTAMTESEEFHKIYNLSVVVIPTHREITRIDLSDRVYKNTQGKYSAVIAHVKELHEKGQPVLIGTISIEHNEFLSQLLQQAGVPHSLLNAKQHEQEAEIIAQAGRKGAVTVATNMAGRGVDIMLGGNPVDIEEARVVRELGGLAVIGTERHESRRIDNQLRGRAGRQGDPGSSQFFISLDDDLMRIFAGDRVKKMMSSLGVPDDMPIENRMVSRSIESAQKKVEGRNFDIRKHLVEYDDVMNKHRDAIYRRRNEVLMMEPAAMNEHIQSAIKNEIEHIVSLHTNTDEDSDWDIEKMSESIDQIFPLHSGELLQQIEGLQEKDKLQQAQLRTDMIDLFSTRAVQAYDAMIANLASPEITVQIQRQYVLRIMDRLWIAHLDQMSFLRDSIGLRGYGQRDPLVEYKKESYQLFQELLARIEQEIVSTIFTLQHAQIVTHQEEGSHDDHVHEMEYSAPEKEMKKQNEVEATPHTAKKRTNEEGKQLGPNDPCFCGSGKKLKKCHNTI